MITITMNELLSTIPVLRELANQPFKGSLTFKLARLMRELDKEAQLFEESRRQLAEKYGLRDENGKLMIDDEGTVTLDKNKAIECNEEMRALLEDKIEINANKIPINLLDEVELSPSQAFLIEPLIED